MLVRTVRDVVHIDGTAQALSIVWEVFGAAVAASSARIDVQYAEGPAGVVINVTSTNANARPVPVLADHLPQIQVWIGPRPPEYDIELWKDDAEANLNELREILESVKAGSYEREGDTFSADPY